MDDVVLNPTIRTQLEQLVGLPVCGANLGCEMLMIQFGAEQSVISNRGTKTVGQFALHIQSPWRLSEKDKVVVGRQDYFENDDNGWFKAMAKVVETFVQDRPTVMSLDLIRPAGMLVTLSEDRTIDVFPDAGITAKEVEAWRFLEPAKKHGHTVVMSDGSFE